MVDDFNDEDFQFLDEWNTEPIHEGLDVPIGLSIRFTDMSSAQIMLVINSTLKTVNREDLMVSRRGVDNVKKRLLKEAAEKRGLEKKKLFKVSFSFNLPKRGRF